jgi:hypothetical protein
MSKAGCTAARVEATCYDEGTAAAAGAVIGRSSSALHGPLELSQRSSDRNVKLKVPLLDFHPRRVCNVRDGFAFDRLKSLTENSPSPTHQRPTLPSIAA